MSFINKVANVKPSKSLNDNGCMHYCSKIDGSYLTHVGMEKDWPKRLLKKGITEQLQNKSNNPGCTVNIGFNPQEKKWYGWSHRALYGFGISSTCKKGDCHYIPTDKDDFLEDCIRFWDNKDHRNIRGKHDIQENDINKTEHGVYVEWDYSNEIKNKKLRGNISGIFTPYPEKYGKGEWVAKTLEDAKQMAIGFSTGSTIFSILVKLGLITKKERLARRGKFQLWDFYGKELI